MYKLIDVDENTWAFDDVMPDGDSIRFFVLNGQDRCLVIDSGYLPVDVKGMVYDLLKERGLETGADGREKEILLANTHGDMDHVGGNGSFECFYMTQTDYDNLNLKKQFPDASCIPADENTVIELGGRTIRYFLAPGHTYGNAVILDETNRILFPGDMIQTGNMFMFGSHRCPEQMLGSLEKLLSLNDRYDIIYACHGQMKLPDTAVSEVICSWKKVLNKEVEPVKQEVYDGSMVDKYCCGFCSFYC